MKLLVGDYVEVDLDTGEWSVPPKARRVRPVRRAMWQPLYEELVAILVRDHSAGCFCKPCMRGRLAGRCLSLVVCEMGTGTDAVNCDDKTMCPSCEARVAIVDGKI